MSPDREDTVAAYPPAEVVIGLDVGTTATKAVAFGLGSTWRATVVREYPLLQPGPGQQVQDPGTLVAAVLAALTDVVTQVRGAHVVAVSVSSAMHGLVGLDADLRPLTPLLTWADARATDEARGLRDSGQATELHRTSGTPVHPMSPLAKLLWFARHEPELTSRVRTWAGLKDLVLLGLTGTLATELSSASGTGLLDLTTRTWNPSALALAGVRDDQLPPVLATTAALGLSASVAARTGWPPRPPSSSVPATGPWATSAPARSRGASSGCPSGPAAPSGWSCPNRSSTPPGACSATRSPTARGSSAARSATAASRRAGPGASSARTAAVSARATPSCSSWRHRCRRAATASSRCRTCSPSAPRCGTPA